MGWKTASSTINSLMRNQYKILAEKYSLVKEDDKEDIMSGLNYLTSDIYATVFKYTNIVNEIRNKLIRKGIIDPNDDNFHWVYQGNNLPRAISTQFIKDIIETAKSRGWSPRPGQKDRRSFQTVIGEWLNSVKEFANFDEYHDMDGAVEMLDEIINDALIHKYDFEY